MMQYGRIFIEITEIGRGVFIDCSMRGMKFFDLLFNKFTIDEAKNAEADRIRIENAKADILMFAGKED